MVILGVVIAVGLGGYYLYTEKFAPSKEQQEQNAAPSQPADPYSNFQGK